MQDCLLALRGRLKEKSPGGCMSIGALAFQEVGTALKSEWVQVLWEVPHPYATQMRISPLQAEHD